jgi:hypothetical protein
MFRLGQLGRYPQIILHQWSYVTHITRENAIIQFPRGHCCETKLHDLASYFSAMDVCSCVSLSGLFMGYNVLF